LALQLGDITTALEQSSAGIDYILMFGAAAAFLFFFGKSADAIQLKKAFLIRTNVLSTIAVLLGTILLGTAKGVLVGTTALNWFLALIPISFAIFYATYKATAVLDIRKKVTKLLLGLPVYSRTGKWLGKVEAVHKDKGLVEFSLKAKKVEIGIEDFSLQNGKLLLRRNLGGATASKQ
jgi:hypothetical protein